MSERTDLSRWNRAGLRRFRYVDGNGVEYLELLREQLAARFQNWNDVALTVADRGETERLARLTEQYEGARRDHAWELARSAARACHVLTEHLDAYANEGFLTTATQWENVRRMVAMLDYHPAPPASASTTLILKAKASRRGTVAAGLQFKHTPAEGGPAVVFETLEEVEVDAALNTLRPSEYDRQQDALGGNTLYLDGRVEGLRVGEPIVIEDERNGALKAHLIAGVLEGEAFTELTVSPKVSRTFIRGYAKIHVVPKDRLAPVGPAAAGAEIDRLLRLAEEPGGLLPGAVVYITDGQRAYYRRVTQVRGRAIVLERTLGPLAIANATVSRPVELAVSRIGGREAATGTPVVLILKVPGDWSRLTGATIGDHCRDPDSGERYIAAYPVMAASYAPTDAGGEDAGYTTLRVSESSPTEPCKLSNPQAVLVPPATGGLWAVDTYLEKQSGHLPRKLVTDKPKKTATGDLAVVARGDQVAWARIADVDVDLELGRATLVAEGAWQDRGGVDWFLADTTVHAHFDTTRRLYRWDRNSRGLSGKHIPLAKVPPGLTRGRRVLITCDNGHDGAGTDGAGPALATTVVGTTKGNAIILADALPAGCTYGSLVVWGNVVVAGHGETKTAKVLGSGDATVSSQSFTLEVAEASFVADATQSAGVRADVEVEVAGRVWQPTSSFQDSAPTDHHYTVRMTEDGYVRFTFGDGRNGRRLPSGSNNVRIRYRKGTGLRGAVPAGSFTKPAKPHRLVEAARQPRAAVGGDDMEDVASLRENAPATVLTIARAVSEADFGHLAASYSGIWQARAFVRSGGYRGAGPPGSPRAQRVDVIVVPAQGGALGDMEQTLTRYLVAHSIPGTDIRVLAFDPEPFSLDVTLSIDAAAYDPDTVADAVADALDTAFSLRRRGLGQDLFLSEVYQVVEEVEGVEHSDAVIDADPGIRRKAAADDQVLVLQTLTVRVAAATEGEAGTAPPAPAEQVAKPVESRPVLAIQGVGAVYAERFRKAGVATVGDLRAANPETLATDVPALRIWEFKVKAELVVELDADPQWPQAFLSRTLTDLLAASDAELVALSSESLSRVQSLRDDLRRLQMALDETFMAEIRLREFK